MTNPDELVIALWSKDKADYYKELEKFHKEHEEANAIEYDNETKVPIRAVYYFRPYTVFVDHYRLMKALAEADLDKEAE